MRQTLTFSSVYSFPKTNPKYWKTEFISLSFHVLGYLSQFSQLFLPWLGFLYFLQSGCFLWETFGFTNGSLQAGQPWWTQCLKCSVTSLRGLWDHIFSGLEHMIFTKQTGISLTICVYQFQSLLGIMLKSKYRVSKNVTAMSHGKLLVCPYFSSDSLCSSPSHLCLHYFCVC